MMCTNKITLTMIAKKSGLSIASVSRVIHTPHRTTRETQKRVNQAISELNFDAKSIFRSSINHHKSKKILVIDNQLNAGSLINRGIESQAKSNGYKILYLRFLYFSLQEVQQIISYTINHHLDGIIIINDSPYLTKLLQYRHALPPIVLVNYFSLNNPCVYFDHLSIAYQATQHLIQHGHQRIAFLLGDSTKMSTTHLESGYLQALNRANITVTQSYLVKECYHYQAASYAIKSIMESRALLPTAIICADNLCSNYSELPLLEKVGDQYYAENSMIGGVIERCQIMKVNIPRSLSLLYFAHSDQHKIYPTLNLISFIHKPLYKMGESALNLLLSHLDATHNYRYAQLIECELISRHSVATLGRYTDNAKFV